MTILVEKRPEQAIPITELRAMSSAYNFRRSYIKLNPEVKPESIVIYRYGRKGYPVCEVWEILENGNKGNPPSGI